METTPKTIAIVGLNASGKTQFVERLRRQLSTDKLRYMAFCDSYGTATDRSFYLQQRWNQHDISNETPRVSSLLEQAFTLTGADTAERRQYQQHLYSLLGLEPLLNEYIIALSSGELRKFQLARTLLAQPTTLILDNPYIGLDPTARQMLSHLLHLLANEQGVQLYLVLAKGSDIPPFAEKIIWTTDEEVFNAIPRGLAPEARHALAEACPPENNLTSTDGDIVVRLRNVNIGYNGRTILDNLSWTVRQGECWALSGPNGSGKSTLLSIICADNPQAYACDIALFGRQRGTGETIWDIKRHIGYVSPEMHRSYRHNIPCLHIVASGLKDTVGLYVRFNNSERSQCLWWMRLLGIEHLEQRPFLQLSSGEQRMVLVARAFVKNPQLLILDEPMHGLDLHNRQIVTDVINAFCADKQKTLIMVTHYEEELPRCITHHLVLSKNC